MRSGSDSSSPPAGSTHPYSSQVHSQRVWQVLAAVAVSISLLAACSGGKAPTPSLPAGVGSPAKDCSACAPLTPSSWAAVVRQENARPGAVGVRIQSPRGEAPGLEAFADRVSVLPGETVGLYVSTAHRARVKVAAYREGYYGGTGFRRVWSGSFVATPQRGPATLVEPLSDADGARRTRAVYAPWRVTYEVTTAGWPEGEYLFRLDSGEVSRYVLLTVRSAVLAGRVVIVNSPMTWQAYNTWGGRGLYGDVGKNFAARSLAVSFDRPYADGYGSGRTLTYDVPIVREAEKLGLPLAWVTDYDLAVNPSLVTGATTLVFGGHAEYWTAVMRAAVESTVRSGTNLAVFGANTAYWRVRLAGRHVALVTAPKRRDGRPRVLFGPKSAALDPLRYSDPAGTTARFRDSPRPQREELLTGMRYDCYPSKASWVVSDAGWWGYAGTGVRNGTSIPGVVGPESDRVYPVSTRPRPTRVVAYTRLSCGSHLTLHTGVYWTNVAGAGVFDAGTMGWPRSIKAPGAKGRIIEGVTANVLKAFAKPTAGRTHPTTDNVRQFWLPTRAAAVAD